MRIVFGLSMVIGVCNPLCTALPSPSGSPHARAALDSSSSRSASPDPAAGTRLSIPGSLTVSDLLKTCRELPPAHEQSNPILAILHDPHNFVLHGETDLLIIPESLARLHAAADELERQRAHEMAAFEPHMRTARALAIDGQKRLESSYKIAAFITALIAALLAEILIKTIIYNHRK